MFGWWTAARRRRLLATAEPVGFRGQLASGIWQWQYLPAEVADAAANWSRIFIAEKYWEGCGGLKLTFQHQTIIAGQASLMALAFPNWFFEGCQTLLVHPSGFTTRGITHMVNGQVGIHGQSAILGQAWYRGPVVLDWSAIARAGQSPNGGHSVTVHEMAHQIDFANGPYSDGVPPLPGSVNADRWETAFNDQLEELREQVHHGYEVLVEDYGLQSPSEFFAVSSELFFQAPHELAEYHAELFELLMAFYQRDWREWLPRW